MFGQGVDVPSLWWLNVAEHGDGPLYITIFVWKTKDILCFCSQNKIAATELFSKR